jgi:hypothetical protein
MIVGVIAGQLKGLGSMAILVDMGEEGTGIVTVLAAAAEHYPFSISTPSVIGLYVGAVHLGKGTSVV